jgi:hypothetical protein
MELLFNELSMLSPTPDQAAARARFLSLQETIQAAVLRGFPPLLRIHEGFWAAQMWPGYSLANWLSDPTIERERKQRLRSAVGKAPFLEALHESAEVARGALVEAIWEGQRGLGLGLAVLRDAPVVSLAAPPFCHDPLSVVVRYLSQADDTASNEAVCNFHGPAAVEKRGPWITSRQQRELPDGNAVIRLRAELLEHLDLADDAVGQLERLTGKERTFPFVLRHLFALNERARAWDGTTPFSAGYPFPCSEESQTTLAMYGESRTFRCPDGVRRVFSWHSKINFEKWRIHFIDDPTTRRVLIGYIGKHLPLAG